MIKNNGFVLAVDGSGVVSYKHPSKEFCISGVVASKIDSEKINIKISKICKKYLNKEDAILHFTEVSRKIGVFDALKDAEYEIKFWSEIISIVENKNVTLVYGLIDKKLASQSGWQQITLAEKCYQFVIKSFVKILKKNSTGGQIITESDLYTDHALIKVHNKFQSEGIPNLKINSKTYHKTITSLSLVNKHNLDSLVQISDLLGMAARNIYSTGENTSFKPSRLQIKLIKLIKRKIRRGEAFYKVIRK